MACPDAHPCQRAMTVAFWLASSLQSCPWLMEAILLKVMISCTPWGWPQPMTDWYRCTRVCWLSSRGKTLQCRPSSEPSRHGPGPGSRLPIAFLGSFPFPSLLPIVLLKVLFFLKNTPAINLVPLKLDSSSASGNPNVRHGLFLSFSV